MSKKKKNIIIAVTALLFFGALLFNLKYPLMSETTADPGKIVQENSVKDSKGDSKADDVNKTGEAVDRQEKEDQGQDKEPSSEDKTSEPKSTTVKPDTSTSNKRSNHTKTPTTKTDNQVKTPAKPPAPAPEPTPPAPAPAPAPADKPFIVPEPNNFASVSKYTSADPDRPELSITMNSFVNYEAQLQQLYSTIESALGSSIANEIVNYARKKPEGEVGRNIDIDREWLVGSRELWLSSGADYSVGFWSWRT